MLQKSVQLTHCQWQVDASSTQQVMAESFFPELGQRVKHGISLDMTQHGLTATHCNSV
jgi:type II secretory pathway component PulL